MSVHDRQEQSLQSLFGVERALIGMVHVHALPGTPACTSSIDEVVRRAVEEAVLLESCGFHAILIENMHDRPYLNRSVGPEIVASMTAVGGAIAAAVDLPLGVQILAGANQEALAVALACGARFIRVEGFVFAHVGDEGWLESDAGDLLRYRRALGAEHIRVFADIKKKHSAHAVTGDVDLVETALAAEMFLADGVIVTGSSTGEPASPSEVEAVAGAATIPTFVGSGVTAENIGAFGAADAVIVGSGLKRGGQWFEELDRRSIVELVQAFATE